ncbi:MAG: UDP-N-acetylglucosamine 2-epimerase (non-hydrolyzing) [Planctomycetes bacterium]|nr:UDP-N-acetylglucosamine 2-epimerase (non-hydrolyzing) [Planctomycetota bacterium]
MNNLLCVVGARPNFIKIAPLIKAATVGFPDIKITLVHTGQHYDYNMSKVFFNDLKIPRPDIHLGIGSGSHASQTGEIMIALEKVVLKARPDVIVVVGDVNSTLAGALVAAKLCIPLAHIEAGLRSFDRTMPEELNRVITDSLSDMLFVPGKNAVLNLKNEGIPAKNIFVVGNIMIDTLKQYLSAVRKSQITKSLRIKKNGYAVVTMHRAGNVDNKRVLTGLVKALVDISRVIPVVFPIHPRTKKQLKAFKLDGLLREEKGIIIIEPVSYLDSINLLMNARLVLTDSGGVQEETSVLDVPCLTLRDETEWTETLRQGTNQLVGTESTRIVSAASRILKSKRNYKKTKIPSYWDGKTSVRILQSIRKWVAKHKVS